MAKKPTNGSAKYLYAVVPGPQDQAYGPIGIAAADVYCISNGKTAAVVSEVPSGRIRPQRRNLAAHQNVLKRLMADVTPLPMSFGIIADGPDAVRRTLSSNQSVLLEQLRRVRKRVEMGVRVSWDVPNVFEYLVNSHDELKAARDEFFGAGREPSQDDKIELGRLFDRTLGEVRQTYTETVSAALRARCSEIRENKPRNEREVMNLACLIPRDSEDEFEKGVFEAAALFNNNYAFDYNGPWAPHNFVELELELEDC